MRYLLIAVVLIVAAFLGFFGTPSEIRLYAALAKLEAAHED